MLHTAQDGDDIERIVSSQLQNLGIPLHKHDASKDKRYCLMRKEIVISDTTVLAETIASMVDEEVPYVDRCVYDFFICSMRGKGEVTASFYLRTDFDRVLAKDT